MARDQQETKHLNRVNGGGVDATGRNNVFQEAPCLFFRRHGRLHVSIGQLGLELPFLVVLSGLTSVLIPPTTR